MDASSTVTVPDSAPASTGPYKLRWWVAGVVLAANLMDVLDATIVNVDSQVPRRRR